MPQAAVSGHRVYAELRRALLRGDLHAGDRMVENDLAATLQVSRTPVREALRRLEGDGLVRRLDNGSVVVAVVDDDDIDELAAVRAEIDTLAARQAMERATDDDWARLAALADDLAAVTPGDADRHHDAHQAFHRALFAVAFRPRMLAVLDNHVLQHLELTQMLGPVPAPDPAGSADRHRELLAALRSGERARAEEVARAHARLNTPAAHEMLQRSRRSAGAGT